MIDKLTKISGRAGLVISKHSPEILLCAGIIGFGVSLFTVSKASIKAEEIMKKHNNDMKTLKRVLEQYESDKYSEEDYKKDQKIVYAKTTKEMIKAYLPTVIVTGLSIGSILCSYGIMRKRHLALLAAYTGLQETFLDYRKRVIEDYGDEKDRIYRLGIREETKAETIVGKNGKEKTKESKELVVDPNHHSQYARFFDSSSTQWNRNAEYNLMFLKSQQNFANDLLKSRGHIFLNEVYDMLGIPRSQAGQIVGWVLGEGDDFVDFGIFDDDGDARDFVNGYKDSILLDFNVDGIVYDLI